mgnify:CR=1 FL=1
MKKSELAIQRNLSDRDMLLFNAELDRQKKHVLTAYVLLVFLWGVGAHQFYLGKALRGILYPVLTFVGWLSLAESFTLVTENADAFEAGGAVGIICLVVVVIMFFVDLVSLPSQCNAQYEKLKRKLLWKLENDY